MEAGHEELYSEGYCHVFAMGVHAILGGSFLLIEDYENLFQEPSSEGEDGVPNIVHVYAIADLPEGPMAIDVFGKRPLDDALAEAKARYDLEELEATPISDRETLHELISDWSVRGGEEVYLDRPLDGYFPDDIENARTLILEAVPIPHADMPDTFPTP